MLAIENNQLKTDVRALQTKLVLEQDYQRKRGLSTDTEKTDLLRAALHFLRVGEKSAVFGRSSGVGEIITKIEGVPGVKP